MTKQEQIFCGELVAGAGQMETYKRCFDVAGLGVDAIRKRAYRLAKRADIQAEVERLRKLSENAGILCKDVAVVLKRQELLGRILAIAEGAGREADKLRAYELYARLAGYFRDVVEADVKVDAGVSFSELLKKAVMNTEGVHYLG